MITLTESYLLIVKRTFASKCSPGRCCWLPIPAEEILPISIDDMGQIFVRDVLRTPLWRTFLWHSGRMTCKVLEETRHTLKQVKTRQKLMGLAATNTQESQSVRQAPLMGGCFQNPSQRAPKIMALKQKCSKFFCSEKAHIWG